MEENKSPIGDSENTTPSQVNLVFHPRIELSSFVSEKTLGWLEAQEGYNSSARNMVIKGNNLSAMAALRVSGLLNGEKRWFDVIYIDPPYNVGGKTGYKNLWRGESEGNFGWAGDHGKFLDFMEPRLKMAKLLMEDSGIIFVSISDDEYPRLLMLMTEIFGPSNVIGTFIWDKKQGSPSKSINVMHEYIICFAKDSSRAIPLAQKKPGAAEMLAKATQLALQLSYEDASTEFQKWVKERLDIGELTAGEAAYNLIHPVTHRVFMSGPSTAQDDTPSRCKEPLKHPVTGEFCRVPTNGWKWKRDTLFGMVDYANVVPFGKGYICGKILFGPDHNTVPRKVTYLDEQMYQKPWSIIRTKSSGASDLPVGVKFATPKPIELLETLIDYIPRKDVRVLDFFAGSATTAHAVENLNKKDLGTRSYVMIEEMASTIEAAILPRMQVVSGSQSFGYFSLIEKQIGTDELLEAFTQHSEEFITVLHSIDSPVEAEVDGVKIVGFNSTKRLLVATLSKNRRDGSTKYFRNELRLLVSQVEKYEAERVILYAIEESLIGETQEEAWAGIKSSIFSGTTCNYFDFLSLPSAVVREWKNTLSALEAM